MLVRMGTIRLQFNSVCVVYRWKYMSNVGYRFEALMSVETEIMLLSINKLYAMFMRLMSISYRISCSDKVIEILADID